MLEWLASNYQVVISIVCFIASIIISIVVKRYVISPDFVGKLFEVLPQYINEAEEAFGSGHGADKLNYVLTKALSFISYVTGQPLANCMKYSSLITQEVEKILSTPHTNYIKEVE